MLEYTDSTSNPKFLLLSTCLPGVSDAGPIAL
jgi:hypothetical protein